MTDKNSPVYVARLCNCRNEGVGFLPLTITLVTIMLSCIATIGLVALIVRLLYDLLFPSASSMMGVNNSLASSSASDETLVAYAWKARLHSMVLRLEQQRLEFAAYFLVIAALCILIGLASVQHYHGLGVKQAMAEKKSWVALLLGKRDEPASGVPELSYENKGILTGTRTTQGEP